MAGSTEYRLKVVNINNPNYPVIDQWNDSVEVLSDSRCSIKPDVALPAGTYKWWIQTRNCKGDGQWSNYMSFRFANILPGKATPISPEASLRPAIQHLSGLQFKAQPSTICRWTMIALIIIDDWYDAEDVTSGIRCQALLLQPSQTMDSVYYWRIRALTMTPETAPGAADRYFETVCSSEMALAKAKVQKADGFADRVKSNYRETNRSRAAAHVRLERIRLGRARVGDREAPDARGARASAGRPLRRGPRRRRREARRPPAPDRLARLAVPRAPRARGVALRRALVPPRGADRAQARAQGGALDEELVATESKNLARSLAALKNDKGRYAARRCLESACEGEPYAIDPEGRLEDLPARDARGARRPARTPPRDGAGRDLRRGRRRLGRGEGRGREAPPLEGARPHARAGRRPSAPARAARRDAAAHRREGRRDAGQARDGVSRPGRRRLAPRAGRAACSPACSAAPSSRASSRSSARRTGSATTRRRRGPARRGCCSCSRASSRRTSRRPGS